VGGLRAWVFKQNSELTSRPLSSATKYYAATSECKFAKRWRVAKAVAGMGVAAVAGSELATLQAPSSSNDAKQLRRVRLRAHRLATPPRRACLRRACLRLRHACTIVSSHVVSARVKRAAPLAPRCHRPACLPARCAAACDSATSRLLEPATLRHPVTLCDSAPTPSVLRSRRPTRTACHLSPPTRGEPSQSFPVPCSAEATSQTLNYQGRRLAFATTRLPRSHRKLSQLPLPAPAPARLSLRLIVPFTHPYTTSAKVTRHSTVDASTMACDVRRRRRRPRPEARAT